MKRFSKICIIFFIIIILVSNVSYARFADLTYPPGDKGKADDTEEEVVEKYDEQIKEQENATAEDYINKSSNNFLKSLSVEDGKLSPEFERQTVDYIVSLNDENQKTITISAKTEDDNATIDGAGTIDLEEGVNKIQVVVTAENGNVRFYNLTINKPSEQSDLRLQELKILAVNADKESQEVQLSPSFDKDIFEYDAEVPYDVNSVQIESKAPDNANVKISGGENLHIGINVITVEVVSEDESDNTTYIININKEDENSINNITMYIAIGIVLIVVILVIVFISKRKKKSRPIRRH